MLLPSTAVGRFLPTHRLEGIRQRTTDLLFSGVISFRSEAFREEMRIKGLRKSEKELLVACTLVHENR